MFRPNYPRRIARGVGDLAAGLWAAGDDVPNRHPTQLCLGEGSCLLCPLRRSDPAAQRHAATGPARYNVRSTRLCRCPPNLGRRWQDRCWDLSPGSFPAQRVRCNWPLGSWIGSTASWQQVARPLVASLSRFPRAVAGSFQSRSHHRSVCGESLSWKRPQVHA